MRMQGVVKSLQKAGFEAYCPLFDEIKIKLQEEGDIKAIFDLAFKSIGESDAFLIIVNSARKSEGQLMEIGAAMFNKKPVIRAIHEDYINEQTHLKYLASKTITWNNEGDLFSQLEKLVLA